MYAYNATTGAVDTAFISLSGFTHLAGLAAAGGNLYVLNCPNWGIASGTVYEYNAATGEVVAGYTSPSGLTESSGLAISGSDLCVRNGVFSNGFWNYAVDEYNLATGEPVPGFTSRCGPAGPSGLATFDGDLYSASAGMVYAYSAITGEPVAGFTSPSELQSQNPQAIVASPVPEPGIWTLFLGGFCLLGGINRLLAITSGWMSGKQTRAVTQRLSAADAATKWF